MVKEITPDLAQVATIQDPDSLLTVGLRRVIEASARSFNVNVTTADVHDATDIEFALNSFAQKANGGLIVLPGIPIQMNSKMIIAEAARHRLPAIYPFRYHAASGGLMSYGSDPIDTYRNAASCVDRILRGTKPGDLPVQAPTKFEFVINLKTAKALGITVPHSMQLLADEVIQ